MHGCKMSSLESIIQEIFLCSAGFVEKLATYQGQPAVFYERCPDENDSGWDLGIKYPRADYRLELQEKVKKKSAGVLKIRLWCDPGSVFPEELEPAMISGLNHTLIQPTGSPAYGLQYKGSHYPFSEGLSTELDQPLRMKEFSFTIREFSWQETEDPDPINTLWRFCKDRIPEAIFLGKDPINRWMYINQAIPCLYLGLKQMELESETNTGAWMKGKLSIHVIGSTQTMRNQWITWLVNQLSLAGEIPMEDQAPMFLKSIQVDYDTDYLKKGQITLEVRYGLPNYERLKHKIQQAVFQVK